ncbi:MAG TPA: YciI family protein [Gammaproteobacteria bacterium]|jgi:hypothetical protein
MQYMLLIYQKDMDAAQQQDQAAMAKIYQEYQALNEDLKKRGKFISNHGLKPASTATTLTVRDGKTVTTDGPFVETREQLGGYYVVEAKDLDEAIGIAERIPSARWGTVEIRPVWG